MIKKKKKLLNHFTLPDVKPLDNCFLFKPNLGVYFVYIFVNSLLQRISNLILLNDFAFCFCFFSFSLIIFEDSTL